MTAQPGHFVSDAFQDAAEFLQLADLLGMPDSERRNVLAMSPPQWMSWVHGTGEPLGSEQRRRLKYVVSMMRRAAANQVAASV